MDWNADSAARYDQWATSACGSYALRQEERLLQGSIASWPRRKQRLIDIGCGTGVFLDFFWSCGFDLTAVDSSPAMLAHARKRMGDKVEFHVANGEHLPFDDREFDYATVMTVLEFSENPERLLREASRVARKGLLITFLNRYSLYSFCTRTSSRYRRLKQATWYTWPQMRAMITRNVSVGTLDARSILMGPTCTWKRIPLVHQLNSLPLSPWFGAITAVRVDFGPSRTGTPLLSWNTEPSGM